LAAAMRAGHWRWHFTGIGREIHSRATDPQGHGRRCLKTETKIMKLNVQSVPEIFFDQPIHRITRTPVAVVARYSGFVAYRGHRRTVEANQARIDLWKFLEDASR
jgi:hypothetical protein